VKGPCHLYGLLKASVIYDVNDFIGVSSLKIENLPPLFIMGEGSLYSEEGE